jgi:hypothetical protein
MSEAVPWVALLALGAFHGVNPAMGWLFAVALGLQERDSRDVWRALPPLAAGHAAAVAVAVAIAIGIGVVVPLPALRWIVAALLVAMGGYRLVRHRHPRFGGMRVTRVDLAVWSFLMASAHGAGLMVVPLVLDDAAGPQLAARTAEAVMHVPSGHPHAQHAAVLATAGFEGVERPGGVGATAVHTLGYLLVTGLVAILVFERLGLRALRTLWVNLDIVWAGALIVTGVLTPLV